MDTMSGIETDNRKEAKVQRFHSANVDELAVEYIK
jgi:hypothetical protein